MLDGIVGGRSRRAAVAFLLLPLLGAAPPDWVRCAPTDGGPAWTVSRPVGGRVVIRRGRRLVGRYAVGRADPGAGSIYYALSRGGREIGYLRAINGGMLDPPRGSAVWSGISVGGLRIACRRRTLPPPTPKHKSRAP